MTEPDRVKEQVAQSMANMGMVKEDHSPLDIVGDELNESVCKPCTQEKSLKNDIVNSKL